MAEYHTLLRELEELVETRVELVGRGSQYVSSINLRISLKIKEILREQSLPTRAEEYYRRLKIVRNQLAGHPTLKLDWLISQQESLLLNTKPNVSKPTGMSNHDSARHASPRAHHPTAYTTPATQHQPTLLHEPPALYMRVLRINARNKRGCQNKNPYIPIKVKVGGVHNADRYCGYTHWLLANPKDVGVVMWSRASALVVVQSYRDGHVLEDTLHIQTNSEEDAVSFADYMRRWYASRSTHVYEVGR
ncbi:MAG: hypothetical protein LQ338_006658 [Usnochroma carphineum]|nr:MAG: hypothetical protein LQ338_006658 [Usnochroma carphineum]